ncbi:hypothetical protein [Haliea atlantica]|jgi:hypothetical protein|nr:hypothetical protein [Haliea sp.]MAL96138.1 hypothetical protein [Haliea sp.]|tara:strand:- start:480 stop:821 length:342 start_codon:yes stop_codon:yes gene_type:complete
MITHTIRRSLLLATLPLVALGARAEVTQDCILEGTVDKGKAEQMGRDVYVEFHSAARAERGSECNLQRRNRIQFKEPKNAMIENAPDGSKVRYRYTEKDDQQGEWRLIGVAMP